MRYICSKLLRGVHLSGVPLYITCTTKGCIYIDCRTMIMQQFLVIMCIIIKRPVSIQVREEEEEEDDDSAAAGPVGSVAVFLLCVLLVIFA